MKFLDILDPRIIGTLKTEESYIFQRETGMVFSLLSGGTWYRDWSYTELTHDTYRDSEVGSAIRGPEYVIPDDFSPSPN